MEYDVKRATRVDLKKRKARNDEKLDRRSLMNGDWEDLDEDDLQTKRQNKKNNK
jgi:hypothetical protein